jgi:long-chain acyl-CoA synthetase
VKLGGWLFVGDADREGGLNPVLVVRTCVQVKRRLLLVASKNAISDGVLLTGVTGFIGMELLVRYLECTDRRVYAFVRGKDDREVTARVERTLLSLFGVDHPHAERVVAIRSDIARPGLGIRHGDELAEQVSEIVHGAASVSFELGLRDARAVNVEGTRRMLKFAELCQRRGGLRRFSYISTAFVAGEHAGHFSEDELDVGQSFRNAYERSKFEAESLVARASSRIPVTVMRPGIVVGERVGGWTASFNVLYWPLRAFAQGAYAALPARRNAPVDVVPVDYVADAIFLLAQAREAEGATFHLTAGAHASTVGELVELATAYFRRPPPRLIEPAVYKSVVHPLLVRASRDERYLRALARSEVFFPYFATKVLYDDRRSRVALCATGLRPPPLGDYFNRLMDFALASEWGRRPISRAGAVGPGGLWTSRPAGGRLAVPTRGRAPASPRAPAIAPVLAGAPVSAPARARALTPASSPGVSASTR